LSTPLGVILIDALGGTVHGLFFLFLLPIAPFIIVGLVVVITTASAQRTWV